MKAILHCIAADDCWIKSYFSDLPTPLLPIANKNYLDYWIDYCVLNKVDEIYVLSEHKYIHLLEKRIDNGEKQGTKIIYFAVDDASSIKLFNFIEEHQSLFRNSPLLVLSGYFWLNYNVHNHICLNIEPNEFSSYKDQIFLIGNKIDLSDIKNASPAPIERDFKIDPLNSIQDYYSCNMKISCGEAQNYVMPTYNNNSNVYIGQNVSWQPNTVIQAPVHLGNEIQIENSCEIGPHAIVGSNVFIDHSVTVKESVIMPNSYIGVFLALNKKIVYRNKIIDPITGVQFKISDDLICRGVNTKRPMFKKLFHRLMAIMLIILMFVPYILLRPWITLKKASEHFEYPKRKGSRTITFFAKDTKTFIDRLFLRLSLDRFFALFLVITANIRLVGNRWLPNEKKTDDYFSSFPEYVVGLFSLSEINTESTSLDEIASHEHYYLFNASFSLNCHILVHSIIQRLLQEL